MTTAADGLLDEVTVHGPRLSLRFATQDDAPALFELGRDPAVTRFFSWGPYTSVDQPLAYVRSLIEQRARGERLEFLIVDRDDQAVGVTGLSEFSTRDRRALVGSWLGRAHWGTGANAESKALVLALAFRGLGLLRVTALANPRNDRSVRALERLGFVSEGVLRSWHVHPSGPEDCTVLGLLADEFEGGRLATVPVEIRGRAPGAFALARAT